MYQFFGHVKIVRISLDQTKRYCGSQSKSTYYDILGIPKNASKKDIRDAFIKLSKKIHPDKSTETSAKSHDDFIKISEAYNVLSKEDSRQHYDFHLKYYQARSPAGYRTYNSQSDDDYSRSKTFYYDQTFYQGINNARSRQQRYTYTYHGNKKFTTSRILFYCFLISVIGTIVQIWAIMKSPVFNREGINRQSEYNFEQYQKIRSQALNKSNAKVIDDFSIRNTDFDTDADADINIDADGIK